MALRIGIAGLGVVGEGLLRLLARMEGPDSGAIVVAGISARHRSRPRGVDISGLPWFDDPVALARAPGIDAFVELIGGSDGPAKAAVEAALTAGKPVVTANKALLALHGAALADLAEAHQTSLLFEAAVAGGVPIVRALRDSLAGAHIDSVAGVLNGTCNFILSEMQATGRPFPEALADAQARGFAEADPFLDISGGDAAHKLTILAALAFQAAPNFAALAVEGIERVSPTDFLFARQLGFRLKLVAKAGRRAGGAVLTVRPTLLRLNHPLAQIDGALNAIVVDADPIGRLLFTGPGAGAGPTASAVASDVIDLLHAPRRPPFGASMARLAPMIAGAADLAPSRFYLRMVLRDQPGALAAVARALADEAVSIDSIYQNPITGEGAVPVVVTTQVSVPAAIARAVETIAALPVTAEAPWRVQIED